MRWTKLSIFRGINDVARATVFPIDKASSKRLFVLIYLTRLFYLVGQRLWHDNCPRQAAALAYQTMLSIVPLLAVVVSIITSLNLDDYHKIIMEFISAHLMPDSANSISHLIIKLANSVNLKTIGVFGGLVLLILSLVLLFIIENAINEIFRLKKSRPLWERLLIALTLLVLGPLGVGLSLYYTGKLLILPQFISALKPLMFSFIPLFLCYYLIPYTKMQIKLTAVAALSTGIMLEILKIGFAFYVSQLGNTLSYLYGTFALLPLAMVWIYLIWLIFLFGAELNAGLHEVKRYDRFDNI